MTLNNNNGLCIGGTFKKPCKNKGKYKQYPNDGPDVPKICGVHLKQFRRQQKMLNEMGSRIFAKVISK